VAISQRCGVAIFQRDGHPQFASTDSQSVEGARLLFPVGPQGWLVGESLQAQDGPLQSSLATVVDKDPRFQFGAQMQAGLEYGLLQREARMAGHVQLARAGDSIAQRERTGDGPDPDCLGQVALAAADRIHAVNWNLGGIISQFREMGWAAFQAPEVTLDPSVVYGERKPLGLHMYAPGARIDCRLELTVTSVPPTLRWPASTQAGRTGSMGTSGSRERCQKRVR
jgi:hypothetical protein